MHVTFPGTLTRSLCRWKGSVFLKPSAGSQGSQAFKLTPEETIAILVDPVCRCGLESVRIPLGGAGGAFYALIHKADTELVTAHRWRYRAATDRNSSGPYAQRYWQEGGCQRTQYMHTLLTGFRRTDHANGNGLDNRQCNLRAATARQNAFNSRKPVGAKVSRFKGLARTKGGRWAACIRDGKMRHLGMFDCEIEAAQAYDRAAIELHGEFARLNFPAQPLRLAA